jgi:hypothetical protein
MKTEIINSNIVRRQTLEISISRACKGCGAPAAFQKDQSYIRSILNSIGPPGLDVQWVTHVLIVGLKDLNRNS